MPRISPRPRPALRAGIPILAILAAFAGAARPARAADDETVRAFFDEGTALLVTEAERERLAAASPAERRAFVAGFLAADPDPSTPDNELLAGIAARRQRIAAEGLSPFDDRGRLLFLHGVPTERTKIECAETFVPLELWSWGAPGSARTALLFRPGAGRHFRLWYPTDSKRDLYTDEMQYLLEQFEELRGRIRGKRIDLRICKDAERIDDLTGVSGLFGFRSGRLKDADVARWLEPPADLAAWARAANAEPLPDSGSALPTPEVAVSFPAWRDQRLVARLRLTLPAGTSLEAVDAAGGREVRLALHGVVDQREGTFEEFRTRFVMAPPALETPVALVAERALRPRSEFVLRLELRDETTGRLVRVVHGVTVPAEPTPEPEPLPATAVAGRDLALTRLTGRDTIVLLPPPDDVLFGLFRAEAIVAGERIRKVVFSLDDRPQLTRSAPPWSAELRLPTIPREVVVRVEGLDEAGKVVAADELLINEPQGEARVRLLEPARGKRVSGRVRARAAVVVPEGRRVESVEFQVNDEVVAKLEMPPWEASFEVPSDTDLAYLTVTAVYDDGTRVEDFRVLNSAEYLEEIEVELVEIFATVTDREGNLIDGLGAGDFELLDNGRPQRISKFERVRELPLTLGLVLDTSGSMREALGEAKSAASGFLASVMTPKDRCFAVGFTERPVLLMPLTSDATAVDVSFRDLPAIGATALHDALVYSLYQYRGVRGRRAMVLLSDGDDTASLVPWADVMTYAQRAGVSIYTIGLGIGPGSLAIRDKLKDLAAETGGRTFFIEKAAELAGVYDQIERELRSQYLLAFSPDPPAVEGGRHEIEVRPRDRAHRARSARGYTP